MNISFERIFGTKPCNNKNYCTVLLPFKSDKIRYKSILFPLFEGWTTPTYYDVMRQKSKSPLVTIICSHARKSCAKK